MPEQYDQGEQEQIEIARARARAKERAAPGKPTPLWKQLIDPRPLLTTAETVIDDRLLGAGGLATDVLMGTLDPSKTIREYRDERAERRATVPAAIRLGSAFIKPTKAIPALTSGAARVMGREIQQTIPSITQGKLAQYAGKAGEGLLEGGVQAGLGTVGENIGTTRGVTVDDVKRNMMIGGGAASVLAPLAYGISGWRGRPQRRAGELLSEARATDAGTPKPSLPTGPHLPETIELDFAGPAEMALARGVGKTPEGRAALEPILRGRLAGREAAMQSAFDVATGTTPADAENIAREIEALTTARQSANAKQKAAFDTEIARLKEAHAQATEAASYSPSPEEFIASMNLLGEGADPIKRVGDLMAQRKGRADVDYPAARKATAGVAAPQTKKTVLFLQTPVGKKLWAAEQRLRKNEVPGDPSRKLPTVVAKGKDGKIIKGKDGKPVMLAVPDASAWHRMKAMFTRAANLAPDERSLEGISKQEAESARGLADIIFGAQNPSFRKADEPFRQLSETIEAVQAGGTRARVNPPVKKWSTQSLTAQEAKLKTLSPDNAEEYRQSLRQTLEDELREKGSRSVLEDLGDPKHPTSRRYIMAYGEEGRQALLAQHGLAPKPSRLILPDAPVEVAVTPRERGIGRGLEIRGTPNAPSRATPEQSLSVLRDAFQRAGLAEQQGMQQAAAAAFRDELASGGALNLNIPERLQQFTFAAKPSQAAQKMAAVESRWKDIAAQEADILRGEQVTAVPRTVSEEAARIAAQSMSPSAALTAIRAGRAATGSALRSLGSGDVSREIANVWSQKPGALERLIAQLERDGMARHEAARTASLLAGRLGMMAGVQR